MAYRLLHDGRHKDKYRAEKSSGLVLAMNINDEPVVVTRNEVQKYVNDPAFGFYLQCWQYTKLWGTLEWKDWPIDILEAMTAIEYETKSIEAEEMENMKKQK